MSESFKSDKVGAAAGAGKGAFAHLHVHSDYSLSKGASKVKEIVKRAAEIGVPALALVDEANMYGAWEFSKEATAVGIQPIVGTKLWMSFPGSDLKGSLVLLAQNAEGYANVCYILAQAHVPHEGAAGGEGIIDTTKFAGHLDGVVCLTGGHDGIIWKLVEANRASDAAALLDDLRDLFCDRLFVEISRTGDEDISEVSIEDQIIDLAVGAQTLACSDGIERTGVPLVATSESWYATVGKHDAFEILRAVESKAVAGVKVTDTGVVARSPRRFHIRSYDEMATLFADIPEALSNTAVVARRCAFKVENRAPVLPPFETGAGRSEAEELKEQSRTGLEERFVTMRVPEDRHAGYRERLEFELGIIEGMGFPGYFLIVSDFIKWAKAHGIPVGPGRGSGAGSLVAYALQITNIDPIPHGLLFERFLNPERVSMPDFDIDFCQDRREEVIQYVVRRYGSELVSLIATFGLIKSKTAIKDVGRVAKSDDFGEYGFGELDRLTKLVPMEGPEPKKLKEALSDKDSPHFREMVESDSKYRILIENAMKVEGLYRSQGVHAAGIVIGGRPLHELGPMGWDSEKQMPVSQFNMKASESIGFVKFDFLGLKTLSVLRETVDHIRATTGVEINLDLLPLDDAPTYEMLAEGMTNGIFQFESDGMKKWLRQLRPDRFADLVAMTSLYRPGPMEMIPHYVDCKNGVSEPHYPEPASETKLFLEETYGIMVYQEQVMLVAQKVAGYSLGGADLLRRAMGKKIPEEMAKERGKFVDGAVSLGRDAKAADELFDHIAKFAGYGFNKSHAAAYSLISYHTAYLKRHYPAHFFSAVMTYEMGTTDGPKRMAKIKEDMEAFGIPMLLPDINRAFPRFTPEEYEEGRFGVRFGLAAIKGVSADMSVMLEARRAGPFASLQDFHKRAGTQFNKGQLERLAEAGAFDLLAKNRASADNVLKFLSRGGRKTSDSQADLFGGTLDVMVPAETADIPEWGNRVDREFKSVGFYFGEHPMERYEARLRKIRVKRKGSLQTWMKEKRVAELGNMRVAGLVEEFKAGIGKKGSPYVMGEFSEKSDSFTVWFNGDREKLDEIQRVLHSATLARRPVVVEGKVVLRENGISIYGDDAFDAEELMASERGRIRVVLDWRSVLPTHEESTEIREAVERAASGEIDLDDLESLRTAMRVKGIRRKAADVGAMLQRMRDDENRQAVPVIITLKLDENETNVVMEGKYLVDQAAENAIKAVDGVHAVSEEV